MVMYDSATSIARFAIAILTGSAMLMTGCSDPATDNSSPAPEVQPTESQPTVQVKDFEPDHMAWIPGGTFAMGSDDEKPDERPIHEVTVGGIWMDKTEVTQIRWEKIMGFNPSKFVNNNNPVDYGQARTVAIIPTEINFGT